MKKVLLNPNPNPNPNPHLNLESDKPQSVGNATGAHQRPARIAGFTLVELLFAVFFIFAALSAIIVSTNNVTSTGQHNEAAAQVQSVIDATRAWGRQPSQGQNYTDVSLDVLYCNGINIAPFKPTTPCPATSTIEAGVGQNVYGLNIAMVGAGTGTGTLLDYAVTFGTGDAPNCQALLDKFSAAAGVISGDGKTFCDTDVSFTLTVTVN